MGKLLIQGWISAQWQGSLLELEKLWVGRDCLLAGCFPPTCLMSQPTKRYACAGPAEPARKRLKFTLKGGR